MRLEIECASLLVQVRVSDLLVDNPALVRQLEDFQTRSPSKYAMSIS